jgi:hypothetical protein
LFALRQSIAGQPRLSLNSWSFCLSLLSAGITGMHHHGQLEFFYAEQKLTSAGKEDFNTGILEKRIGHCFYISSLSCMKLHNILRDSPRVFSKD